MFATTIPSPFTGEDLIGIEPELLQQVDPGWRRRLSLFTGRALSETALDAEQAYRCGRLAMLGQAVTAGTVSGLEVAFDTSGAAPIVVVQPGYGILDNGEDVTLLSILSTPITSLAVLDADGNSTSLFTAATAPGSAGILLLQPVVVETNGSAIDTAPTSMLVSGNLKASCDQDPSEYAFQDLELVDGCRLAFMPWPNFGNTVALPAAAANIATWRNRIANAIFAAEASLPPDESFPWSLLGLPLGVLGLDPAGKPLFLDRGSVVRQGGLPRRRYALPSQPGLPQPIQLVQPALAQARIAQFTEQIVQTANAVTAIPGSFTLLPPAGVVPAAFVDLAKKAIAWVPTNWTVQAGPIHLEELEAALHTGMTAAPLDLTEPESIELLVPLPNSLYDPNILVTDVVDPAFQKAIDDATAARNITLQHRKDVQLAANVLLQSSGQPKIDLDASLTADEKTARDGTPPVYTPSAADAYGTVNATNVYTSVAMNNLQAAAAAAPYTTTITVNGTATTIKLFSPDDINDALNNGVQHFINRINAKLSRADDLINLAFVTAQTDIYRYRQNVLGASDASRLATSPILANIAMGDSASATAQNIGTYFDSLPGASAKPAPISPPGPTPAAVPAVTAEAAEPRPAPPQLGSVRVMSRTFMPVRSVAPPTNGVLLNRLGATTFHPEAPFAGPVRVAPRPLPPVVKPGTGSVAVGGTSVYRPPAAPVQSRAQFDTSQLRLTTMIPKTDLTASHVASTSDVQAQQPVVGAQLNLRTLTIAERLGQSKSQEALFYSLGNRLNVTTLLLDLEITIDDLQLMVDSDTSTPPATTTPAAAAATPPATTLHSIPTEMRYVAELRQSATNKSNAATLLASPHLDSDSDEAGLFSSGVRVLDQHTQLLRVIEGRIQLYRDFLSGVAAPALTSIQANLAQAEAALTGLDNDLQVERQDLAFTLALLSDETARVNSVNLKRMTTLATSVQVVAFTRPRTLVMEANVPSRQLVPGDVPSPVPACLGQSPVIPPELRDMISLLRETPVAWYPWAWALVEKIERPALLNEVMAATQARAAFALAQRAAVSSAARSHGTYASTIVGIFNANQQGLRAIQAERAKIDAAQYALLNWRAQVEYLQTAAALADLIATAAIHAEIAIATARLIQQVSSVAACLYTRVGLTLPTDRLQWAEYLRGPGATVELSNLAVLPSWNTQAYVDRQQMQLLVDWLFHQIDRTNNSTTAFISDIVRTCILLASHAPASAVLAGALKGSTVPVLGNNILLTSTSNRIAHGMGVYLYQGSQLAAEAVVSDLDSQTVTATITRVHIPNAPLADKAVAHFTTQHSSFAALKAFAR